MLRPAKGKLSPLFFPWKKENERLLLTDRVSAPALSLFLTKRPFQTRGKSPDILSLFHTQSLSLPHVFNYFSVFLFIWYLCRISLTPPVSLRSLFHSLSPYFVPPLKLLDKIETESQLNFLNGSSGDDVRFMPNCCWAIHSSKTRGGERFRWFRLFLKEERIDFNFESLPLTVLPWISTTVWISQQRIASVRKTWVKYQ